MVNELQTTVHMNHHHDMFGLTGGRRILTGIYGQEDVEMGVCAMQIRGMSQVKYDHNSTGYGSKHEE